MIGIILIQHLADLNPLLPQPAGGRAVHHAAGGVRWPVRSVRAQGEEKRMFLPLKEALKRLKRSWANNPYRPYER